MAQAQPFRRWRCCVWRWPTGAPSRSSCAFASACQLRSRLSWGLRRWRCTLAAWKWASLPRPSAKQGEPELVSRASPRQSRPRPLAFRPTTCQQSSGGGIGHPDNRDFVLSCEKEVGCCWGACLLFHHL